MNPHITSSQNTLIKHAIKLSLDASYRKEHNASVAYGEHVIYEALKHGCLQCVFIANSIQSKYQHLTQNTRYFILSDSVVQKTARAFKLNAEIFGIINVDYNKKFIGSKCDCVVLDKIQDAGNMGSILRSTYACGIENIIILPGSCDPYNIKVLRSSQGIGLGLNIQYVDNFSQFLELYHGHIVATDVASNQSLYQLDLKQYRAIAWVFGNEGCGVDPSILSSTHAVSIPMKHKVESLNVAIAASVCLFEMVRQRQCNI